MDTHTKEQRRRNMKAIRSRDTSIELILRKELWRRGYRYRVNCKDVYGKPDILFKRNRVAIFCDSEFWHGYDWNARKIRIKTNREYWIPKIEKNVARDKCVNEMLKSQGYVVIRFWGFEIKNEVSACADQIVEQLANSSDNLTNYRSANEMNRQRYPAE